MLQLKQELLRCNMAKDQLGGENVRSPPPDTTALARPARASRGTPAMCVLQEELKHKLSEGNKLIAEYQVPFSRLCSRAGASARGSRIASPPLSFSPAAAREEGPDPAAAAAEAGGSTTAGAGGRPRKGRWIRAFTV